jgi:hypothetical protein
MNVFLKRERRLHSQERSGSGRKERVRNSGRKVRERWRGEEKGDKKRSRSLSYEVVLEKALALALPPPWDRSSYNKLLSRTYYNISELGDGFSGSQSQRRGGNKCEGKEGRAPIFP